MGFFGWSTHYIKFEDEGDEMTVNLGPGFCCRRDCCCACLPSHGFRYSEVTEVRRSSVGDIGCCTFCDKRNEHGNVFVSCPCELMSCGRSVQVVEVVTPNKARQTCCVHHTGVNRFVFEGREQAIELTTFL